MKAIKAGCVLWFRARGERGAHQRRRNNLIASFHPFLPCVGLKGQRVEKQQERSSPSLSTNSAQGKQHWLGQKESHGYRRVFTNRGKFAIYCGVREPLSKTRYCRFWLENKKTHVNTGMLALTGYLL